MYIKEIKLTNIKSVRKLHMTFDKPAGWHVILGDNGAGKTTIIRAICSGLVGPTEILRINPAFQTWVTTGEITAEISLKIEQSPDTDKRVVRSHGPEDARSFWCKTIVKQDTENGRTWKYLDDNAASKIDPKWYNWSDSLENGWFSAAFGPYRRFVGGDDTLRYMFKQNPKIGAHLSAFNEGVTLTESIAWLKDAWVNSISKKSEKDAKIVRYVQQLLNKGDLLPDGYSIMEINSDGLFFSTPSGDCIHLYELSDGLKSIISLTLELLRLLVERFGPDQVFSDFPDSCTVGIQGVVIIDEIDVHLHPSWQARIGQWFTNVFPKMQFIVTTHSPIICRAGVKGSIWHLEYHGTETILRQVHDQALYDLLYGDILDAYDTGIFGLQITRSTDGQIKMDRLADLNLKRDRSRAEELERELLIKRFRLDDTN